MAYLWFPKLELATEYYDPTINNLSVYRILTILESLMDMKLIHGLVNWKLASINRGKLHNIESNPCSSWDILVDLEVLRNPL